MKFRPHANFTTGLAIGTAAVSHAVLVNVNTVTVPYVADMPFMLVFALLGCSLVDADILLVGPGHRMNSLLHKFELPLIIAFFLSLFLTTLYFLGLNVKSMPIFFISALTCFCLGWFFHLCGDFIQGGLGSLFTKKKIGFKGLKWTNYDNNWKGTLLDMSVLGFAVIMLGSTILFPRYYSFSVFPEIIRKVFNIHFPDEAGYILGITAWMFSMILGKGGFKSFLSRLVILIFAGVALYFGYDSLMW